MSIIYLGTLMILLIAIYTIEKGHGLNCYYCITNESQCTNVQTVSCNDDIARATNHLLGQLFSNVSSKSRAPVYDCIWMNHTYSSGMGDDRHTEIRSCTYRDTNVCKLKVISLMGVTSVGCKACSRNFCNPALKITPSILATVLTIASGLFPRLITNVLYK